MDLLRRQMGSPHTRHEMKEGSDRARRAEQKRRRRQKLRLPATVSTKIIENQLWSLFARIKQDRTLSSAESAQALLGLNTLFSETLGWSLFNKPKNAQLFRIAKGGRSSDAQTKKHIEQWAHQWLARMTSFNRTPHSLGALVQLNNQNRRR